MANPLRAETEVKLGNKQITLRPSFQALCEIEEELGESILNILTNIASKGLTLKQQASIIYYGSKAGGYLLTKDEVEKLLIQRGIGYNYLKIIEFLKKAIGVN